MKELSTKTIFKILVLKLNYIKIKHLVSDSVLYFFIQAIISFEGFGRQYYYSLYLKHAYLEN